MITPFMFEMGIILAIGSSLLFFVFGFYWGQASQSPIEDEPPTVETSPLLWEHMTVQHDGRVTLSFEAERACANNQWLQENTEEEE